MTVNVKCCNEMTMLTRLRRLRKSPSMRALFQESTLSLSDIIYPIFVIEGIGRTVPIGAMPGQNLYSIDRLIPLVASLYGAGIKGFAIFPCIEPSLKDLIGSQACNADNVLNKAVRAIKSRVKECVIFADVALDPYTTHGHDGIVDDTGYVLNDETCEALVQQAVVQAESGADVICPSDMMDGRVKRIRHVLESRGHKNTAIMAYAVKYASYFYTPFRQAVGSVQQDKGDKKTYQMNFANMREAMRSVEVNLKEGADMIMIKPGMLYLDVLAHVKRTFMAPTLIYQVSAEYSMLQAMIENKTLDKRCILESLIAFKRAGADAIFTYFSPEVVALLSK